MLIFVLYLTRLLEYIENYTLFAFLSFFIRGLEALGASAYSTASYVFVVNIFPDHIGTVRVSEMSNIDTGCMMQ